MARLLAVFKRSIQVVKEKILSTRVFQVDFFRTSILHFQSENPELYCQPTGFDKMCSILTSCGDTKLLLIGLGDLCLCVLAHNFELA